MTATIKAFKETSLSGNIVTLYFDNLKDVLKEAEKRNLENFAVQFQDDFTLSFPMQREHHIEFAALIHRTNSENKLKKNVDKKGGKGDNKPPSDDPTPPSGGTPIQARPVEFTTTEAIAA